MKVSDNNIKNILGQAGLSSSEQDAYVAGLGLGTATSAQIIKHLGAPRPTAMAALRSLSELGLCETTRLDGRSYSYRMLPASNLKTTLGKRIRQLDSVIDSLDGLALGPAQAIETKVAEGQEPVQDMLELALRCRSRTWQIIAPRHNALGLMPADYINYFKRVRKDRQIVSQSLWEESSKKQIPLNDVLMRKPRFVPGKLSAKIPSLMLAFDSSLLILDQLESGHPSAVLINNAPVVKTFQIMFEMAWRSARD